MADDKDGDKGKDEKFGVNEGSAEDRMTDRKEKKDKKKRRVLGKY